MDSVMWMIGTLVFSILLIIISIIKFKFHPFLALLLTSFFVGIAMNMEPQDMVSAIENGIGGTL